MVRPSRRSAAATAAAGIVRCDMPRILGDPSSWSQGTPTSPRFLQVPGDHSLLEIGGYRISLVQESDEPWFLARAYRPFLSAAGGPADLTVRLRPGVEPWSEGEIRFENRPFWHFRLERGGARLYGSFGRSRRPVRAFRVDPSVAEVELRASPEFRRSFVDHPESDTVSRALFEEPLDQLFFIDRLAADRSGIVLHGAAVVDGDRAWIFAGESGRGKSTLSSAVRAGTVLTDDRPIVRVEEGGFRVHGSPWYGQPDLKGAGSAKLAGIYLLDRSLPEGVHPIGRNPAFRELLHLAFPTYWIQEGLEFAMDLLDRILEGVPVARLSCRKGEDVVGRYTAAP